MQSIFIFLKDKTGKEIDYTSFSKLLNIKPNLKSIDNLDDIKLFRSTSGIVKLSEIIYPHAIFNILKKYMHKYYLIYSINSLCSSINKPINMLEIINSIQTKLLEIISYCQTNKDLGLCDTNIHIIIIDNTYIPTVIYNSEKNQSNIKQILEKTFNINEDCNIITFSPGGTRLTPFRPIMSTHIHSNLIGTELPIIYDNVNKPLIGSIIMNIDNKYIPQDPIKPLDLPIPPTPIKPLVIAPVVVPVVAPVLAKPIVAPTSAKPNVSPASAKPIVSPTSAKPVVSPASAKPIVSPASAKPIVSPASAKPVVSPAPTKPFVSPTPSKPVVSPAPSKPVVSPASAKPVVSPTPSKPVVAPASAKAVVSPTPSAKAVVSPASAKPIVSPTTKAAVSPSAKPIVSPTLSKPVVAPTLSKPVVALTPTKPVVAPTQTKPVIAPTPTKPIVASTLSKPVIAPVKQPTAPSVNLSNLSNLSKL